MGWKEYYQTSPESFCLKFGRGLLKRILQDQTEYPLCQKESLRLALGGFSPRSKTASAFIDYCDQLRPNHKDEIYLIDLNCQPFQEVFLPSSLEDSITHKVQSDLTRQPFGNQSLDLIFLDGTTSFMKDEQLSQFGQEANRTLTEYGVVIALFPDHFSGLLSPISQLYSRVVNRTLIYCRSTKQHQSELTSLKLLWYLDSGRYTALVLGRQDNPCPEFSGYPYCLDAIANS
ncbi:MAG: hypothetical protein PHX72_00630 [Candidatus Shapirobacteria bacterium]|nr:hypothetical protein [Candidatus Shapirobacteria bacterium]